MQLHGAFGISGKGLQGDDIEIVLLDKEMISPKALRTHSLRFLGQKPRHTGFRGYFEPYGKGQKYPIVEFYML